MKFTVAWAPTAERKLAEIWMSAADPQAIADAADEIERKLKQDAHLIGESREANQRILIEPPLAALFEVEMSDRYVLVRAIWQY